MPKCTTGKTSDKRKHEFLRKLQEHETRFGAISGIHVLFDGLADFLVKKGIATELEIIETVEHSMEEQTEKNLARQAQQSHMM